MTRRYDWSEVPPGVAVVETVADLDETDAEALPPLTGAVNVDALDGLLRGNGTTESDDVFVSFRYHGCDVAISSSGWLEIER